MHDLASFGLLDVLKKLIEAPPSSEGEDNNPAAEATMAVDINTKDDRGCTPLIWAARNGHVDVVHYLCSHGGDVNTSSYGGMTPLHHSCNTANESCVAELLEDGADANQADDCGNTSLHYACSRGVLNIVVRLTEGGADVAATNKAGSGMVRRKGDEGEEWGSL